MSRMVYYDWQGNEVEPPKADPVPMTNADRIRSMSDEELADEVLRWFNWLNAVEWDDNRILDWLKTEVTD